jgi:hypothetical protein
LTDETKIEDIVEGKIEINQQEAIIETPNLICQVEVDTPIGIRKNDGGFMSILHGSETEQVKIYYCPMCGRKLNTK